jgi:hypothetical protein
VASLYNETNPQEDKIHGIRLGDKLGEGKGVRLDKKGRGAYIKAGKAKGTPKKQPSAENPDMFGRP